MLQMPEAAGLPRHGPGEPDSESDSEDGSDGEMTGPELDAWARGQGR